MQWSALQPGALSLKGRVYLVFPVVPFGAYEPTSERTLRPYPLLRKGTPRNRFTLLFVVTRFGRFARIVSAT